MAKRQGRRLALGIGTALAIAVGVFAFLRFFPVEVTRLRSWIGQHVGLQEVIQAAEIHLEESSQPCRPESREMTVTSSDRSGEAVEPLVRMEVGTDGTSLYARYSGHWSESRSLILAIDDKLARVDARIDTDYGSFVGSIQEKESKVYLQDQAVCFDRTVERMESTRGVERWRGRLPLRGD